MSFQTSLMAGTALMSALAALAPTMARGATLDLTGTNRTLPQAGYFGGQSYVNGATDNVTNNGAATAILTEGGGPAGTFYAGIVSDGAAKTGLTHTGGSVLLTGANTFTGGLTITGGTVIAGANQTLGGTANSVTVSGGTLGTGATTQQIQTLLISGGTASGGTVTVNNGGRLTAANVTITPGVAALIVAPGGILNGPLTNGGLVGNAGVYTGNVVSNVGSIGNVALWNGNVVSNRGNIGNVGQWNGSVSSGGNIGNNGVWNGPIVNLAGGVIATANNSVINGPVTNGGQVLAYGGVFNGDFVNTGTLLLPGPGSIDANAYGPAFAAAAAGTLIGNGNVTSKGNVTNTGTGVLQVVQGATYAVTGTLANQAGGQVFNAGQLTAAVSNSGVLDNQGQWNGSLVNLSGGQVSNTGIWVGDTTNASGGEITASGTFSGNVTNNGTYVSTGSTVTGNFANTGSLSSTSTTIGQTLTNSGTINLTSGGLTSNSITANQYVSQAGAKAVALVNLGGGPAGGTADQFNFKTISGGAPTLLTLQNTSNGTPIAYHPSVTIVNGDTNNVFQVSQNDLNALQNGFISYTYNQGTLTGQVNAAKAATAGIQVASISATLNSDFFQDWQPFITAPQDPDVNSISGGPWIRGKYGNETIDSTASQVGRPGTASRVSTEFSGFQLGGDVGIFNINKTGWNLIGGVTGGEVFATSNEQLAGNIKGVFEIPFVGAYGALTNGPFHADVLYRHDFYGLKLSDQPDQLQNQRLEANGDSINFDTGYNIALGTYGTLGNFFIEPNGSLILSKVQINPLAFRTSGLGTLSFNDVDSILGRAGFRFGTSLTVDKLALQPFMTAAVWHEFEGNTTSTFNPTDTVQAVPLSVTRIGTFGQFGVGLNGELLGSNILGTIRADFRVGEKVDGQSVTAQLRYQF